MKKRHRHREIKRINPDSKRALLLILVVTLLIVSIVKFSENYRDKNTHHLNGANTTPLDGK